jgi:gliding motility-associated transport system ATP-binding protein
MINVNGITKYYGDFKAVDNISFTVRDGEITGLLGPNGAGKTTTLRMLTCYLEADSGSILVNDFKTDTDPVKIKKIIGYLPESAPLYSDMLVYDYLKYIADIRQIENKDRIAEIGKLCGINEIMHKPISDLSKGYKQRVGLAHAMIHDPDILVLDEPTSGLDPNQIIEIRNLIKEIGKKKTVILSTHILSEVEATCDKVIIINKGKIVANDTTENLLSTELKNQSITISVKGTDYNSLSSEIKSLENILEIDEIEAGNLISAVIKTSNKFDMRPEIFKLIRDKGWILYEMKQEQASLENVFRDLTKGEKNG